MADLKLIKSKLNGEVKVPPSKSMGHRAIICAALGHGTSKIYNIDYSDDMIATIEGMSSFGAVINKGEDYLEVVGAFSKDKEVKVEDIRLVNCKESGSTLRFLVPISLLFDGKSKFIGEGNLGKRPLKTFYDIFDNQGIEYSYTDEVLDLIINGSLKADTFEVEGNVSSQFITGLLFTLPLLDGDSKIVITTEMESKGYIDLTLSCLKDFGIEIINNDYKEFIIKGNQEYQSREYRVEGDYSQAAFFLSANALGSDIIINDLKLDSLQGDKEVIDILKRMGLEFKESGTGLTCTLNRELNSTVIDGSQCPDIIPVISVVAALSKGITKIINSSRLRIKECDRLKAMATELTKLGAKIEETKDGLIIEGVEEFEGGVTTWSWKDHRISMSLAIASTRCKNPIIIKDSECVAKSYPGFFEDFKMLGGTVNEWSLGQ